MLILVLIDVQYLQRKLFSFEKGSNRQKRSSSGSLRSVKKSPPVKFPIPPPLGDFPPPPLTDIWKTLTSVGINMMTRQMTLFFHLLYEPCLYISFWNFKTFKIQFHGVSSLCIMFWTVMYTLKDKDDTFKSLT